MELTYDPAWIESPQARPLSLSLPLNFDRQPIKGDEVQSFFDNLLPDSEAIRSRIRSRFHTTSGDAFDLLAAIGRDCVGAIQLLAEDQEPDAATKISAKQLDDRDVERILRGVPTSSSFLGVDDEDFRISLAGAQEKTALLWHRARWCIPRGSTPTTHIFKLPLGLIGGRQMDMRHSLENEWLCARILAEYGIPVAASELKTFGSVKTLVVTRFDRTLHSSGRYLLRLPQEDFCQATATPSSHKYEADGGPGVLEIARLLRGSESGDQDVETFLRAQLLFWMLAATDGHAKNFSLRLLPEGRYRSTPLYDVLSAWPIVGRRHDQIHRKKLKMAMSMRGKHKHYRIVEIDRRHFMETAKMCGVDTMDQIVREVAERTESVVARVEAMLPHDFPASLFEIVTKELVAVAKTLR